VAWEGSQHHRSPHLKPLALHFRFHSPKQATVVTFLPSDLSTWSIILSLFTIILQISTVKLCCVLYVLSIWQNLVQIQLPQGAAATSIGRTDHHFILNAELKMTDIWVSRSILFPIDWCPLRLFERCRCHQPRYFTIPNSIIDSRHLYDLESRYSWGCITWWLRGSVTRFIPHLSPDIRFSRSTTIFTTVQVHHSFTLTT